MSTFVPTASAYRSSDLSDGLWPDPSLATVGWLVPMRFTTSP